MWVGLDFAPVKCIYCEFYEKEDMSVGLHEGCEADYLYDKDGGFIDEMNDKAIEYMRRKGWNCPYFRISRFAKKNSDFKAPKKYRNIKELIRYEEQLYKKNGDMW